MENLGLGSLHSWGCLPSQLLDLFRAGGKLGMGSWHWQANWTKRLGWHGWASSPRLVWLTAAGFFPLLGRLISINPNPESAPRWRPPSPLPSFHFLSPNSSPIPPKHANAQLPRLAIGLAQVAVPQA